MSQFAELFKAVKNEPKNSPVSGGNKQPAPVKNLKQVKAKNEKSGENKFGDVQPGSDAQNLKKQTRVSEKAKTGNPTVEKSPQPQEKVRTLTNKKIGKSSNADFTQVLTYIRKETHRQIKKVLIDDLEERDLSDLVEELLNAWLEKNA